MSLILLLRCKTLVKYKLQDSVVENNLNAYYSEYPTEVKLLYIPKAVTNNLVYTSGEKHLSPIQHSQINVAASSLKSFID